MPSFVEIGSPVLEKIFKYFTIYGRGGQLGHVTWIISSPEPKDLFAISWSHDQDGLHAHIWYSKSSSPEPVGQFP